MRNEVAYTACRTRRVLRGAETEGCLAFRAAVPLRRLTRIASFHHPFVHTRGRGRSVATARWGEASRRAASARPEGSPHLLGEPNGGARRHPSSDIATQCLLRSGDTVEPQGKRFERTSEMKKKLMMAFAAGAVTFGAWAETETVGGYTWT